MTKNEFLDILRTTLTGELPDIEVENNMKFYDEYIKNESKNNNEDLVIDQLGNPRLIAKTIIETYQFSHGPIYNNINHDRAYQEAYTTTENSYEDNENSHSRESNPYSRNYNFGFTLPSTWVQKLISTIIVVAIILVLIFIGGIIIRLFFTIGVPLFIIYIFYKMLKNNQHR